MVFWQKVRAIFNDHKLAVITCCLGLFLYYLPFIILGEDSYIRVHDNLDSELLFNMLSVKYFWQFGGTIPELANLEIASLNTFSYFQLIFYAFLPPFAAYMTNDFVVRLSAFVGMYCFLTVFCPKLLGTSSKPINAAVALLFALLPVYTVYGMCAVGLPLLILAFYWIDRKVRLPLAYALAAYYALSSSVILSGYFVLIALFVMCCRRFFAKGRWQHIHFYVASFMVFALYVLVHIKTFYLVAMTDFVSHRQTWDMWKAGYSTSSLTRIVSSIPPLFFYGHYHGGSVHVIAMIVILAVFATALAVRAKNPQLVDKRLFGALGWAIALQAGLSVLNSLLSEARTYMLNEPFGALSSFEMGRLFHVMPLTVYTTLVIALLLGFQLLGKLVKGKALCRAGIIALVLISLSSFAFTNTYHPFDSSSYTANYPLLFGSRLPDQPTYREFVDTKLFAEIDRTINRPKSSYRVASLGIFPSAASMNGFYTVDGYMQNYSLDYWERFRLAIAPELDKDTELNQYYLWGSRCFLFAADLGKQYARGKNAGITASVDYALVALRALGCEYIFSAVEITNADQLGLQLIGAFEHSKSYWRIHLYSIT